MNDKVKYKRGDLVYVIESRGYVKGWHLKYQEPLAITAVLSGITNGRQVITYEINGFIEPEDYVVKTKRLAVLLCYERDKQR